MKAKSERQAIADHAPWKPPAADPADTAALQALARGNATADQQKRALDWIVIAACGTYDFAYRPGENDRDTNVALGRQFVGQQIVKQLKLKIGLITARGAT
jgi:hypothetical protein